MAEVRYEALEEVVSEAEKVGAAPVYLLHGDEFLYKVAFKSVLDHIVPPDQQALNYEPLDGETAHMDEVISRLNTFPLFPSEKVIALHDTHIFFSKVTVDELLHRSKGAFERDDLKQSAHHFVRMLTIAGLSLEDVDNGGWQRCLDQALGGDLKVSKEAVGPWIREIIDYCLMEQIRPPTHGGDADVLSEAITTGFPKTNHLVITAEFVDRRRKLYKTIEKVGVVIDCSIPRGDRAADRRQQKETLLAHMEQALTRAGKTMFPGGFEALYEKTGSALRSFSSELDKVITFVGDRREILADDIEKASDKTKEDPIYELTNALGQRDVGKALLLVDSLLRANYFPLQILSAAVNYIRRVFLARDWIQHVLGNRWKPGMSYGTFQKRIWGELDKDQGDLLGKNMHPFVMYKIFVHSENYTFDELAEALEILLGADMRLKTSGQDAKLVLEHAILAICGPSTTPTPNPGGRPTPFTGA